MVLDLLILMPSSKWKQQAEGCKIYRQMEIWHINSQLVFSLTVCVISAVLNIVLKGFFSFWLKKHLNIWMENERWKILAHRINWSVFQALVSHTLIYKVKSFSCYRSDWSKSNGNLVTWAQGKGFSYSRKQTLHLRNHFLLIILK